MTKSTLEELIEVDVVKLMDCLHSKGMAAKDVMIKAGAGANYLNNLKYKKSNKINRKIYARICEIIGTNQEMFKLNDNFVVTSFGKRIEMDVNNNDKQDIIKNKIANDFSRCMNPPEEEEAPRPTFAERMAAMHRDADKPKPSPDYEIDPKIFDPKSLDHDYEKMWNELKRWAVNQFLDDYTTDISVVELLEAIKRAEGTK